MMPVVPPHVRDADPLHERLQLPGPAQAKHQVPVVAHKAPSKKFDAESPQAVNEDIQKRLKIGGFSKDCHSAIAAIKRVVDNTRLDLAERSWHDSYCMDCVESGQNGA
jgi:hypothetical protein